MQILGEVVLERHHKPMVKIIRLKRHRHEKNWDKFFLSSLLSTIVFYTFYLHDNGVQYRYEMMEHF